MARSVLVNDKMQRGYGYTISAPPGRQFHPELRPELTPKQMLEPGVFCGKYLTDCRREFPASWFKRAKLSPKRRDCSQNYFGRDASQLLSVWRRKGWIHPDDLRGWFQWYCRYYMGRRGADDARQIKRWKAIKRHVAQLRKHSEPGDPACRPRQRQALLRAAPHSWRGGSWAKMQTCLRKRPCSSSTYPRACGSCTNSASSAAPTVAPAAVRGPSGTMCAATM